MLQDVLTVQRRVAGVAPAAFIYATPRTGRANWRVYSAEQILEAAAWRGKRDGGTTQGGGARRLAFMRICPAAPEVGRARFGDLAGTAPIAGNFGYSRGQPINRFYIVPFLKTHVADNGARVPEIGGDGYSCRFRAERVTRQNVLRVLVGNAQATFVENLASGPFIVTARSRKTPADGGGRAGA